MHMYKKMWILGHGGLLNWLDIKNGLEQRVYFMQPPLENFKNVF